MTIVLLILATYLLTLALVYSDGAWGAVARVRSIKWVDNFGLLNCFLCTSVWVSAILCIVFLPFNLELILYIFAVAGAATALDRVTTR